MLNVVITCCIAALMAVALSACSNAPARKQTVWDLYDVRYPVPAGSNVPTSRATQYDRYTDNDAFYTRPSFGLCGSNDIGCAE